VGVWADGRVESRTNRPIAQSPIQRGILNRYDVIAIGGGAAGLVTAAGAAGLGARVALVERERLGGECLWTGCVPSKALLAAARAAAQARQAERFGVKATPQIDFARVLGWVRAAQAQIAPHDSPERFRSLGVDVVFGSAHFTDANTIAAGATRLQGRHIVIATGSSPAIPAIPGLDATPYHTNETIFGITEQPASLLVLGGGPIGVELAQAFTRLGTRTTLVEQNARVLPLEDQELTAVLAASLQRDGVDLRLGRTIARVERVASGVRAALDDGSTIEAAALLVATGRTSRVTGLELARADVAATESTIMLDDRLRTTVRHIWAAGDVTGAPRFTHVADYQARLVLRNALFPLSARATYDLVPFVTYTDPELAHVGLGEAEARERHGDVRVWRRAFSDLDRAVADGETTGMVKLIATPGGRLLGGHVLGHGAGSLIAEIVLAMKHGVTLTHLANTMHAYPTYPEAIKQAADGHVRSKLSGLTASLVRWLVRA